MARQHWRLLCLAAVTRAAAAAPLAVSTAEAAIYADAHGGPELRPGAPGPGAMAWGSFEDGVNVTGWGVFNVRTSFSVGDNEQHFAAGMVEGFLTARHIYTGYLNAVGYVFQGNVSQPALRFLEAQLAWAREQAKTQIADNLWQHTGALLSQLDGLIRGYGLAADKGLVPALEESAFLILNGVGDLFQIIPAVDKSRQPNFAAMTSPELRSYVQQRGMCSAIIKVPGDYGDLFMSHSSWFSYADMNRIFKHYHFAFHMPSAANRISFSSYPGYLESLDDFYMMDSGLGMVQTSNNILNETLFRLVRPETLLAWQRVRVANVAAHTGEEWFKAFRTHASGTYVNQYMVVDFKLFKPKKELPDGTLWVMEEIPGLLLGADQTETLRRGYWPSYNVPYYREIYRRSGYSDERLGADGLYDLAPRGKIFRRDQATIVDLASLKRMMRYANYSDPYARNETGSVDYSAAICMRGDLASGGKGRAGGCYDTKVTSALHGFWNLSAEVVNGPSSISSDGTDGLSGNTPFAWRPSDNSTAHFGLPRKFDFGFMPTKPSDLACESCLQAATIVV